jgi:hypothetical protein
MMALKLIMASVLLFLASGLVQSANAATVYTVVKNDNLSHIALRLCGNAGLYRQIARENGIANPDLIRVGQKLKIVCAARTVAQDTTGTINTLRFVGEGLTDTITAPAYRTTATRAEIVDYIISQFGLQEAVNYALPIFTGESGLGLTEKGYNCYYYRPAGKKYSRACDVKDRHLAWSVDCGIAQINVRGKHCPAHLYTLEGNIAAAKRLYAERRWQPWIQYTRGHYRAHTRKYRYLLRNPHTVYANAPIVEQGAETVRVVSTHASDSLRFVGTVASAPNALYTKDTVVVTNKQVVSLRE